MLLTAWAVAVALSAHSMNTATSPQPRAIVRVADVRQIVLKPPASEDARPARKSRTAHKARDMAVPGSLGHMTLESEYTGPLQSTIMQRWRDSAYGTVCYIYLPVIVRHGPALKNGLVDYGANQIGSISCFQPR